MIKFALNLIQSTKSIRELVRIINPFANRASKLLSKVNKVLAGANKMLTK